MKRVTAYLALGSNLGDRETIIRGALSAIGSLADTKLVHTSSIIETPPMGQPNQRHYLNAAACVHTQLPARELLEHFLQIETHYGRRRSEHGRWGSRELDIDLLLYGEEIVDEPGLSVPHPHMHERLFVLRPLAEIAPHVKHPVLGATVSELLAQVRSAVAE